MKTVDTQEARMLAHVVDQLKGFKYYDVHGKSYEELKRKLATLRAMEVEVQNPGQGWF
ncbi:hypothetical protein [Virgibacillus salexigens]|uniref:hypothetical protein n=1 Tax=Virgibacillus TaxID=84406 RepID=UPI00136FE8DB|nr:hypothetical protein [Virgibacillus massiliensis]MYL41797.1 hypothetical protein [Virgibacillus massiliensis]